MKLRKLLAGAVAVVITAGALITSASAYTAWLNFQTASYSFRDAYNSSSYGLDSGYYDSVIVWGTEEDEQDDYDYDLGGNVVTADFKNADITADGTYTVSLEGADWSRLGAAFNMIYFSSDIPLDSGVKFSDVTLVVDGTDVFTYTDGYQKPDETKITLISVANTYDTDSALKVGDIPAPAESLAIRFTVSGLTAADEAPAAVDADAATDDKATNDETTTPDTGVEGVAAIGGIALIAAAAVVIARKRK